MSTLERAGGRRGGSSSNTMGGLDVSRFAEQSIEEEGRVPREGGADGGRERSVHEPLDEDVLQGLRAGGHAGEQGLQRLVAPAGRFRPLPGVYGWACTFSFALGSCSVAAQAPYDSHRVTMTTFVMSYSMLHAVLADGLKCAGTAALCWTGLVWEFDPMYGLTSV